MLGQSWEGMCCQGLYENSLILRTCMTQRPFVHTKALVDSNKSLLYIEDAAKVSLNCLNSLEL